MVHLLGGCDYAISAKTGTLYGVYKGTPLFFKEHGGVIADPYVFQRTKCLHVYIQRFRWFSKYRNNLPNNRSVVEFDEFVSDSDVGIKLIRFFTSSG